jgi:hypothetical protein
MQKDRRHSSIMQVFMSSVVKRVGKLENWKTGKLENWKK